MNINELKPGVLIKYQGYNFTDFYRVDRVLDDSIAFTNFHGSKFWEPKNYFASDVYEIIYSPD